MTAPASDFLAPAASLSSSGFSDGLGHRVLAFDREEGVMLERLYLRPELAAFESLLRDRLDRAAALEDERVARPRTLERTAEGGLVVVSEFVPGSRLSDLLETAREQGMAPGVDAALGFLLDVLPALCALHAGAGFAHGALAPCRIVLTPAGQTVLLDTIHGGALTHLGYPPPALWRHFGIVVRPAPGPLRLHVDSDIGQAALGAVTLVLGRPLRSDNPDGLRRLLREVVQVAQIRASVAFARGIETFLERTLPLRGGRAFASADDALIELRDLAGEIGLHVCRRALVDAIAQLEGTGPAARLHDVALDGVGLLIDQLRDLGNELALEPAPAEAAPDGHGTSLDLEILTAEAVYDIDVPSTPLAGGHGAPPQIHDTPAEPEMSAAPPAAELLARLDTPESPAVASVEPEMSAGPAAAELLPRRDTPDCPPAPPFEPEVSPAPPAAEAEIVSRRAEPVHAGAPDPPDPIEPAVAAAAEAPSEPASPLVRLRRAKRSRSSRARKDRLRSAAASAPLAGGSERHDDTPLPAGKPDRPPQHEPDRSGSWLVAPGRAEAFEPPVYTPASVVAPVPPAALPAVATAVPVMPVYAPAPAPAPPPAQFSAPPPIAPAYLPPPAWTPPSVTVMPMAAGAPADPAPALKLKTPPLRRGTRVAPVDIYSAAPAARAGPEPKPAFPWKLAAAVLGLMVLAVVAGRFYLPTRNTPADPGAEGEGRSSASAGAEPSSPVTSSRSTGRIEIETQPAGARVLLDGKPVGHSPLVLEEVTPGRRTVTIASATGTLRRTVRVEAGQTAKIDVPIFSGWIDVSAPFVVEVATGGRVIGTTEEPRLMLNPGRHTVTLTNRALGYSSAHTVDVEPGQVRPLAIDPRGHANLNASPWAEVWIDGQKAGDTPIARLQLPLGTREVVFRHPELGERRRTITVRADTPTILSVDMQQP